MTIGSMVINGMICDEKILPVAVARQTTLCVSNVWLKQRVDLFFFKMFKLSKPMFDILDAVKIRITDIYVTWFKS